MKGKEQNVAAILNSHLSDYNDSWEKINLMIGRIFDKKFRYQMTDSFGNPWIFNWHCLDHVGYKLNPRKRDLGYFKILIDIKNLFLKMMNMMTKFTGIFTQCLLIMKHISALLHM